MANEAFTLPRALTDIMKAPRTSYEGNELFENWAIEIPDYDFRSNNFYELRLLNYQADVTWPNVVSLSESIYETVETCDSIQVAVRSTIANPGSAATYFINTITECKGLLGVTAAVILLSLIIIPVVSIITCCCCYFRYKRKDQDYYNYSMANSTQNEQFDIKDRQQAYVATSNGGLAAIIIALIAVVGALFGVGAAIHLNHEFTYSLNSTLIDAVSDGMDVVDQYREEFEYAGNVLMADFDKKIVFLEEIGKKAESMITDEIFEIARKSQIFALFIFAIGWEGAAILPIEYAIEDAEIAMAEYGSSLTKSLKLHDALKEDPQILSSCQFIPDTPQTCATLNLKFACFACLVPEIKSAALLFSDPRRNSSRTWDTLATLKEKIDELATRKAGDLVVNQDAIIGQFQRLFEDFTNVFQYYENWYKYRLKPVIDGTTCDIDPENVPTTTTLPTTIPIPVAVTTTAPAVPITIPVIPITTPTTATTAATPATTAAPTTATTITTTTATAATTTTTTTTELPTNTHNTSDESKIDKIVDKVELAFLIRHIVILVLLCVGALSLVTMLIALICLLFNNIFARSDDTQTLFHKRKPAILETVARILILLSLISYLGLCCPLLGIITAGHFYASGYIETGLCRVVKYNNLSEFDLAFGEDLVRSALPECIEKLVDSVDESLLNRISISQFLEAADNDTPINEYIGFDSTKFIREAKDLRHIDLTSKKVVIFNEDIEKYMDEVEDITAAYNYFQPLVNSINLVAIEQLNKTVRNCTTCVLNAASTFTNSSDLEAYKDSLVEYLARYNDTMSALGELAATLSVTATQRDFNIDRFRFMEAYADTIFELLKKMAIHLVNIALDKLFAAVNQIGRMGMIYDFYDRVVNAFLCQNIMGSLHAFWFFSGIYLLFTTIATLILCGLYGGLSVANLRLSGKEWRVRKVAAVSPSLKVTWDVYSEEESQHEMSVDSKENVFEMSPMTENSESISPTSENDQDNFALEND